MTTVATLSVIINANDRGLQSGLRKADSAVQGFGSRMQGGLKRAGDGLQDLGKDIGLLVAPLAAFGVAGINVASTFQSSMNEISARTGLVGEDLERVRQYALDLGASTAFSAQDASEGLLQLLSSGSSAAEAMAILPGVMDLAAAGTLGLGYAADTVTDIMAQFGIAVETYEDGSTSAEYVTNNLAKAAGASSASVEDLAQGFANVGPVAAMFGLDVRETAATLATLAENGIKGAEGGTALKSVLLNLTRPTDKVKGALKQLGVSLFDANGEVRDFDTIIDDLDYALDQLPMDEQIRLSNTLAGSYGITAFNALRASGGIDGMMEAMNEAAGASEVADARLKGFGGALEGLQGSVETLMINALTPFMDNVLTPMIGQITPVVNEIGAWIQDNPELASGIGTVALAGVALAGALWLLGTAAKIASGPVLPLMLGIAGIALTVQGVQEGSFDKVALGVAAIGAAATIAFGPIGLLAGVIAGLIAGLAWLEEKTQFLSKGIEGWKDAASAFQEIMIKVGMIPTTPGELLPTKVDEAVEQGLVKIVGSDATQFIVPLDPNFVIPADWYADPPLPEGFYRDVNGAIQEEIALNPIRPETPIIPSPTFMLPNAGKMTGPEIEQELAVSLSPILYNPDGTEFTGEMTIDNPDYMNTVMVFPYESTVVFETPPVITWADSVALQESVRESMLSFLMGLPISFDAMMSIAPIVTNVGGVIDSIRNTLTAQPLAATIQAMISVSPILSGVTSAVSAVVAAITGAGGGEPDGSHASGLAFVPKDGYLAELHYGERVLTAAENRAYTSGDPTASGSSSGGNVIHYHYHIDGGVFANSEQELGELMARIMRQRAA